MTRKSEHLRLCVPVSVHFFGKNDAALILTCNHAWLLSTHLLQGVKETVLVGLQLKLGANLVQRVSRGLKGHQELRVPQAQEETEDHLERQAREDSRWVNRDCSKTGMDSVRWLLLKIDLITDLQGIAGFPGVKGLKGQKGDFTVIDIKGEFYDKLFHILHIVWLIKIYMQITFQWSKTFTVCTGGSKAVCRCAVLYHVQHIVKMSDQNQIVNFCILPKKLVFWPVSQTSEVFTWNLHWHWH